MLGGQEHELNIRTAELIEDNAQQALELLIRYATSSRTLLFARTSFSLLTCPSGRRPKPPTPELHNLLDARNTIRLDN